MEEANAISTTVLILEVLIAQEVGVRNGVLIPGTFQASSIGVHVGNSAAGDTKVNTCLVETELAVRGTASSFVLGCA